MARPPKSTIDPSLLGAALEGLEIQKKRLEEQISMVRSLLAGRAPSAPAAAAPASSGSKRKRNLSPEARERIAAAQKKRWAAYRKTKS